MNHRDGDEWLFCLQKSHSSPSPSGSVTIWHSLFHLSYIYDNVVYERYAKNIKYQNLSKKESK